MDITARLRQKHKVSSSPLADTNKVLSNTRLLSSLKMTAFWDTVPCSLIWVERRFGSAYCLHHQGNRPDDGNAEQRGRVVKMYVGTREVPDSNLSPETGYLGCYSWLSSVLSREYRDSTLKVVYDRFLPNPFQFIIHEHPFIRRFVV
jgi:hypothetical protein